MKILEVRFKNLSAFTGEWAIDFSLPAYQQEGLFGIFGPTGSGKTTILDAICLALYGATPRLGKITKSSNEIMSRQQAECYAEVLFQIGNEQYRAHWQQRKARKLPNGNLQEPEHQLIDVRTNTPVQTQRRSVLAAIEKTTGLDFERFTRSILLAQGAFDRFLRANTEQKSKILEQITGTALYSVISQQVHQSTVERREVLKNYVLQRDQLLATEGLPSDRSLQTQYAEGMQQRKQLQQTLQIYQQARDWYQQLERLEQECQQASLQWEQAQAALQAFEPTKQQMLRAEELAALDPLYEEYQRLVAALERELSENAALQAQLPIELAQVRQQNEQFVQSERALVTIRTEYTALLPRLEQYRMRIKALEAQQTRVVKAQSAYDALHQQFQLHQTTRLNIQQQRQSNQQVLFALQQYTKDHAQDATLITQWSAIQWQCEQWLQACQKVTVLQEQHRQDAEKMAEFSQQHTDLQQQVADAQQQIARCREQHQQAEQRQAQALSGKLLREYQAEKESLEQQARLLHKIEQLETERNYLQAGAPCPLCGSLEHPYQTQTPQRSPIEEKIQSLQLFLTEQYHFQERLQQLASQYVQLQSVAGSLQTKQLQQQQAQLQAQEKLAVTHKSLQESVHALEQIHAAVNTLLAPYYPPLSTIHQLPTVRTILQDRYDAWGKTAEQIQVATQTERQFEQQLLGIVEQLSFIDKQLHQALTTVENEQAQLTILEKEHVVETQGINLEQRHQELYTALTDQEQQLHTLQSALQTTRNQVAKCEQAIAISNQRVLDLQRAMEVQQSDLEQALLPLGYAHIQDSLMHKAEYHQRQQWQAAYQAHIQTQVAAESRWNDRKQRLMLEREKAHTTESCELVQTRITELLPELDFLEQQLQAIAVRIQQVKEREQQLADIEQQIADIRRQNAAWEQLYQLIGSADGRKFRNFAQGITFASLLSYANQQLRIMSDRYLLVADLEQPLTLQVSDQYQAGIRRSADTLSGGESFMVSLALALGLAKMTSQKVQVQSLFLDEGFGTLDEETLDLALEALNQVQAGGVIIGIISHVPSLKERIRSQISVIPLLGGISQIRGSGCVPIQSVI